MNKAKLNKIEKQIDKSILAFRVFDEPRPKYVAKVTVIDKIFEKTILKLFPRKYFKPNLITVFRFVSIPFVLFFLLDKDYMIGFILFAIAAFSDAVDGAMARTRNQITDWGIVFDPLADKLLIGSVGFIVISSLISLPLALSIVFIELMLIVSAYFRFKGEIVPAKLVGKIKMILQSFGVGFLLIFLAVGHPALIIVATYTLYLAIVFAILSLVVYRSI
ncbi:MAG: CDP-alcohol phosphatidyltransferase family protein [Candidatus Paceibacterota bacterium]|jgi:cardiolipin synthase